MSAAEKLKALHEAANAYITADDLGQQAIRDANHFVDVMVECAPQIVAVVEAAEQFTAAVDNSLVLGIQPALSPATAERVRLDELLRPALSALNEALT